MIVSFSELPLLRKENRDRKIVLTGGVFDLLHRGHIDYVKKAKSFGDILVVAVTNDTRVRERKGNSRPIQNEKDRAYIMDSLKAVDYVLVLPEKENSESIPTNKVLNALQPDVFVTVDTEWDTYKQRLAGHATELIILSIEKVNSTTNLIQKTKAK